MSESYIAFSDCATCSGKGFIKSGPDASVVSQWQCPHCLKRSDHGSVVDHPAHYNAGKFEVIDVIEDWNLTFNAGNALKYIGRHMHNNKPIEDLEKAAWFLAREIARLKDGSQ